MYTQSSAIALSVSDPDVKIRYTLNGKDPDFSSPVYKSQILIQKSSTLKAAGFMDEHISRTTRVDFIKVLEVGKIVLTHLPAEKYSAEGSHTLVDREMGTSQHTDEKWLGFQGNDLEAVITLSEKVQVVSVSLGILDNPGSWIFPPSFIRVLASVDGITYNEIGKLDQQQIDSRVKKGINKIRVKILPAQTRYIKIVATNMGVCPPDHPGAGEPAWLFVDEIILE